MNFFDFANEHPFLATTMVILVTIMITHVVDAICEIIKSKYNEK
jgi:hypothetical protein